MKLSVIIPVYNSEKYLKRCLDSIIHQTFSDFELLLIDDASTDSSFEICQTYAAKEGRIRTIQKQNEGPGAARNLGIKESKGEWLLFIDSDDWVEPNHLQSLVEDIEEGIDFVMHGRYGGKAYLKYKNEVEIIEINDVQTLFNELKLSPNGQICSKLFRSKIIQSNSIEFIPQIRMSEDVLFVLSYLSKATKLKYRDLYTYHYEKNNDSLSQNQKWDFESNLLGFKMLCRLIHDDFGIKDLKDFPFLESTLTRFLERSVGALIKNGHSKKERIKAYKRIVSYNKFEDLSVDNSTYAAKMYQMLFDSKFERFDFFAKQRYRVTLLYRAINRFYKLIS